MAGRTIAPGSLFAYPGGIARVSRAMALIVNGAADHGHLLLSYPPGLALAELVRLLKANSSLWLHCEHARTHQLFACQSGYGAFSVSHSAHGAVTEFWTAAWSTRSWAHRPTWPMSPRRTRCSAARRKLALAMRATGRGAARRDHGPLCRRALARGGQARQGQGAGRRQTPGSHPGVNSRPRQKTLRRTSLDTTCEPTTLWRAHKD